MVLGEVMMGLRWDDGTLMHVGESRRVRIVQLGDFVWPLCGRCKRPMRTAVARGVQALGDGAYGAVVTHPGCKAEAVA